MRSHAEKRLRQQIDRCRTDARKMNVEFNERALAETLERVRGNPHYYTNFNITIDKFGVFRLEKR